MIVFMWCMYFLYIWVNLVFNLFIYLGDKLNVGGIDWFGVVGGSLILINDGLRCDE